MSATVSAVQAGASSSGNDVDPLREPSAERSSLEVGTDLIRPPPPPPANVSSRLSLVALTIRILIRSASVVI